MTFNFNADSSGANELVEALKKQRKAAGMVKEAAYGNATMYMGLNRKSLPLDQVMFKPMGTTAVPMGLDPKNPRLGLWWDLNAKRGHGLCFSTTGGGKNTNIITPALLSYCGSVFCLDPKAENAWITADRRRQMGQKVVILDPWDQVNERYGNKVGVKEKIARFNPLSSLDPKSPEFNDDLALIADGIIITPERSEPHWSDSARELVSGLMAAVVEGSPGIGSFRAVREMLTSSNEQLTKAVKNIVADNPNSLAGRKLRRFTTDTTEISSIRSTAETQTAIFDAARLLDSMESPRAQADAFDLAELVTRRVSLFVVLPADKLSTHGRWMRLIIQLALKAIARQPTPPQFPVLFMLDELGTINPGGGLRMIEQAYGLLGAQGVRIWGFFQTLDQLQRDYPQTWQTFIGNSECIQLMRLNENGTAGYFSEMLGTYTARHGDGVIPKPLRSPLQLRQIPEGDVISLWSGGDPYQLPTLPYFKEPRWNGFYRPNPLYPMPAWARPGAKPAPAPPAPVDAPAINLEAIGARLGSLWKAGRKAAADIIAAREARQAEEARQTREAAAMEERARYARMLKDAE